MERQQRSTQSTKASQRGVSNALLLPTTGFLRHLRTAGIVIVSALLGGVIPAGPTIAGAVEYAITTEIRNTRS